MLEDWFEITPMPDRIFRIGEPGLKPLVGANLWLVEGERAALLIDTGIGVRVLGPVIRGLTSKPVVCLLTHSHYDHIGGAHEFADRRAHAAEAAVLADPTGPATLWAGWLTDASFLRPPHAGFSIGQYAIPPAPATALLAEGDVIDLGGRHLTVLHTPGHSPGCLSLFEPATGTLFSGDALYSGRMFFDLPGSDPAAAAQSLRALVSLGAARLHPGHFESLAGERIAGVATAALAQLAVGSA